MGRKFSLLECIGSLYSKVMLIIILIICCNKSYNLQKQIINVYLAYWLLIKLGRARINQHLGEKKVYWKRQRQIASCHWEYIYQQFKLCNHKIRWNTDGRKSHHNSAELIRLLNLSYLNSYRLEPLKSHQVQNCLKK